MMKFSIIMPVFNAAKSLKESLGSIAFQTFRDFEVIFIDDGSTDDSPSILAAFCADSGIVSRVVRQPVNVGVATARNRGLDEARGEYLVFVDADDRLEPTALEKAARWLGGDPDILGWDWILGFEHNGRTMRQADYATPLEAVKNMTDGIMRWNLWLFAIRRAFAQKMQLRFLDGANMGEDMMFMLTAFSQARKVVQIHECLYRYNAVSTSSISRQFSAQRRREIEQNVLLVQRNLAASPCAEELGDAIQYLKLFLKLPLLISADTENYRLWHAWFPEANPYAFKNKRTAMRTRILQWMGVKRWWVGIKVYYYCVYKVVYGIVYR